MVCIFIILKTKRSSLTKSCFLNGVVGRSILIINICFIIFSFIALSIINHVNNLNINRQLIFNLFILLKVTKIRLTRVHHICGFDIFRINWRKLSLFIFSISHNIELPLIEFFDILLRIKFPGHESVEIFLFI